MATRSFPQSLPASPSLSQLKLQAKELRTGYKSGNVDAVARAKASHPKPDRLNGSGLSQADALLVTAREYGFSSWPRLKRHVEDYEGVEADIRDLREQWANGDEASRTELMGGHHSLHRFENLDPSSPELSDRDARILLSNKRGYAHWVKYDNYLHLDPGVRDVIEAIQRNDLEGLKAALNADPDGANPHYVHGYVPSDPDFTSYINDSIPLFEVSENVFNGTIPVGTNETAMVEALLAAGADPEYDHGHPMTAAVGYHAIHVTRALLEGGAKVDGPYGHGCPMAFALHFGYTEMQQLLIDRGARLDLRFAAGIGDLDRVKSFINDDGSLKPDAGIQADPYTRSESPDDPERYRMERTRENILHQAFYFACRSDHLEVAEYLLSFDIDLNTYVPGLDQSAPVIHWCAGMGSSAGATKVHQSLEPRILARVFFLLENGADPNVEERRGRRALAWAATDAVKDLLKQHGAEE